MSFRTEEKVVMTSFEQSLLLKQLSNRGLSRLYSDRLIESVYFDNCFMGMHGDSEEGSLPRKKIRIRSYPREGSSKRLEIKISSIEGRYKTSELLRDNSFTKILKRGFFDRSYGLCLPKVLVSYVRSYYTISNIRLTFDRDIRYRKFDSYINKEEFFTVVEIKAPADVARGFLENIISTPRRRFSKYSMACNSLGC